MAGAAADKAGKVKDGAVEMASDAAETVADRAGDVKDAIFDPLADDDTEA